MLPFCGTMKPYQIREENTMLEEFTATETLAIWYRLLRSM